MESRTSTSRGLPSSVSKRPPDRSNGLFRGPENRTPAKPWVKHSPPVPCHDAYASYVCVLTKILYNEAGRGVSTLPTCSRGPATSRHGGGGLDHLFVRSEP